MATTASSSGITFAYTLDFGFGDVLSFIVDPTTLAVLNGQAVPNNDTVTSVSYAALGGAPVAAGHFDLGFSYLGYSAGGARFPVSQTDQFSSTVPLVSGGVPLTGTFVLNFVDGGSGPVTLTVASVLPAPQNYFVNSGMSVTNVPAQGGYGVFVASGGFSSSVSVLSGGTAVVYGGAATATTVQAGGSEFLQTGLNLSGTVSAGGTFTISGGTDTTEQVFGQEVVFGGMAFNDTVQAGGQIYAVGGTVSAATVSGLLTVSGGSATSAGVARGGNLFLLAGADTQATISSGATLTVSGGVDTFSTILSGGVAAATGRGVIDNALVQGGGTLALYAGGSQSGANLLSGARLDLTTLAYGSGGTATLSNTTLTVTENGRSVTQQLTGLYGGERFALSNDGAGGTLVTVAASVPDTLRYSFFSQNGLLEDSFLVSQMPGTLSPAVTSGSSLGLTSGGQYGTVNGATFAGDNVTLVASSTSGFAAQSFGGTTPLTSGGTLLTGSYALTDFGIAQGGGHNLSPPSATLTVTDISRSPARYFVSAGQGLSGTVLSSGDAAFIASGGTASGVDVQNGATLVVNGGSASGVTLEYNGAAFLLSGTDSGATVSAGATLTVSGGLDAGSILGSGGLEFVIGSGTAVGTTISSGGVLDLQAGGTQSGAIVRNGGAIDLRSVSFNTASGFAFNSAADTISFATPGNAQNTVVLGGSYAGTAFQYAADSNGGLLITAVAKT